MNQDSDSHIQETLQQSKIILALSLPLTFLTVVISCVSLFTPGLFAAEATNWQAQSFSQHMIELFVVVPCLIITSILAYKKNEVATIIFDGIIFYFTYTFILYSFDVHFNNLFLIYSVCLGLSFYSLMYFLFTQFKETNKSTIEDKPVYRFIGVYFIIMSVLFYFLWVSEIILVIIQNKKSKSLVDIGLFTNGILDISVVLPGIFMTGIFLLNLTRFGFILTPILLTFFVLMDIVVAYAALPLIEISFAITALLSAIPIVSLVILAWYFKSIKTVLRN